MRGGLGSWLVLLVLCGASVAAVLPSVREPFSTYASAIRDLPDFRGPNPNAENVLVASELTDFVATLSKFMSLFDKDSMKGRFVERYRGSERAKYISFGDIHSNIHTLIRSLKSSRAVQEDWTLDPDYHVIVNGDFVDRGYYGVEVVNVLLHLKTQNPERVHLIKGNHETPSIAAAYGFGDQVARCVLQDFSEYITEPAGTQAGTGTGTKAAKDFQDGFLDIFLAAFQSLVDGLITTEQRVLYRRSVMQECAGKSDQQKCYQKQMKKTAKKHLKRVSALAAKMGKQLENWSSQIGIATLPPIFGVRWPYEDKRFLGSDGQILVSETVKWDFMGPDKIALFVKEAYPGCQKLVDGKDGATEHVGAECFDSLVRGAYRGTIQLTREHLSAPFKAYLIERIGSIAEIDQVIGRMQNGLRPLFRDSLDTRMELGKSAEDLSSMMDKIVSAEAMRGEMTLGQLSQRLRDRRASAVPYSDENKAVLAPVVRALAHSRKFAKGISDFVLPVFLSFTQYLPQALYLQVQDRDGAPSHIMFAHGGPNIFAKIDSLLDAEMPASGAGVHKNTLRMRLLDSREIDKKNDRGVSFTPEQEQSWREMFPSKGGRAVEKMRDYSTRPPAERPMKGVDPHRYIRDIINMAQEFADLAYGDGFLWTDMMLNAETVLGDGSSAVSHVGFVGGRGVNLGREVIRAYKERYKIPLIVRAHQHSGDGLALLNKFKGATRLWSAEGHNLEAHGGFVFPESSSSAWQRSQAVPLSEFGADEVILSVATSGSGLSLRQDAYIVLSMQDGVAHYHCDHDDAGDERIREPGACWGDGWPDEHADTYTDTDDDEASLSDGFEATEPPRADTPMGLRGSDLERSEEATPPPPPVDHPLSAQPGEIVHR